MSDEKKLILDMIKGGKITPEQGEKLLGQVGCSQDGQTTSGPINKKFLRILVTEGEQKTVNVNIPLALAEAGLKLIPKKELEKKGINLDFDHIMQLIKEGSNNEIVKINTIENGKEVKVEIYID